MVTAVTSASDFEKFISVDKLVVVDFFAVWCGPCKMIAPMIEKFSTEYSQADFYKVDVDELPDIAKKVVGANPAAVKQAIASNV